MSAALDTRTDIEILEDLDYDLEPPCEHHNHGQQPWHSGPGFIVFQQGLSPCGCVGASDGEFVICKPAWDYAFEKGLHCSQCGTHFARDEWWRFLGTVR